MQDSVTQVPSPPTGGKSNPEPPLSPVKEFLKKWVLYRFAAGCAWIWFICRYFEWQLPIEYRIEQYLILAPVTAFIILIFTKQWALAFFYPFYPPLSPTLLIFLPIGIAIKLVSNNTEGASIWVRIVGATVWFVRSVRFIVLQCVIVIAAWIIVALYSPPEYRPVFALTAHIVGYLLFLQSFRWAANPYRPILFFLRLGSKVFSAILEKLFVETSLKKKLDERSSGYQTCQAIKEGMKKVHDPSIDTIHGITAVTHGYLSAIFTIVFFVMYFGIASSFAASLLEIESGWGKIIEGVTETPNWSEYFYFSFLSQATAIPDDVKPLTQAGQAWIIWLVTTGLLSLTGLITLFTSSAGVYSKTSLNEIDAVFTDLENKISGWQQQLIQTPDPSE